VNSPGKRHRIIAFTLAAISALALAGSLVTHRWFIPHRHADENGLGLISSVIDDEAISNGAIADRRADFGVDDSQASTARWFARGGIAVLITGILSIIAIAYVLALTARWHRIELRVSSKGLVALVLVGSMLVSVVYVANVPFEGLHAGVSLIAYYLAMVAALIANEMLAKHRAVGEVFSENAPP
jgi:hypothetical protein